MTSSSLAQRMLALFEGNSEGYGTYDHTKTSRNGDKNGKVEIKKTADTKRGTVTVEMWQDHLDGKTPLGIIPIRSDNTCRWACADIDKYDLSLADVVSKVDKAGLDLVVCRTKSGGAHIFMFMRDPQPAIDAQSKMREIAAALGFGGCEIFPKQTQLLSDRGDLGNWLNMPYFGGDKTDRFAVKPGGAGMTVSEFLRTAESKLIDDVNKLTVKKARGGKTNTGSADGDTSLEDGPPCLQHLCGEGFPAGTRNKGLFALGVFCKKKFGEDWKSVLESYNQKFMTPPLTYEEVISIEKNLDKKEYYYTCKDEPLVSHCNSPVCRLRKYGVGGGGEYPVITGLSMLTSDPPLWFADVDGERVELTTDQLQNYRQFQKVAMERLQICYQTLKNDTWYATINESMKTLVRIEASPEASVGGYFMEILESFCVDKHAAETKEGLLQGKPWFDEDQHRHYFRLSDLMAELERRKFLVWGRNKVASEVERLGGKEFFNVGGKGVRAMWVRSDFTPTPATALPKRKHDPI